MSEQKTFTTETSDPRETLKAEVEVRLASVLQERALETSEAPNLGPFDWDVVAIGPFQDPGHGPGRIIKLGEKAYIVTIVMMNNPMCRNLAGFGGKVELSFATSDMERMVAVDDMDYSYCIQVTEPCGNPISFFVHVWEFEPSVAACVLETNICARVCNCKGYYVPGYAGFVRWVYDLDAEWLWPAGVRFDHPIRYLVYKGDKCACEDNS